LRPSSSRPSSGSPPTDRSPPITGIRTALGQIVAEELDVSFARVVVVLGDTSLVPNQGATIASETIQITAVPLRKAAAQARQFLAARAAVRLELPLEALTIEDGLIRGQDNRSVSYGELIAGETIRLELADEVPVKAADAYTIVGQSVPRVDLPAKATGELVYVHDVRVPGMLHGRVVRPPYAGVDVGDFIGTSLIAVDETSVRDIPGLVAVVRIGDFVGVVAEREENAVKAAAQLEVSWKPVPTLPDLKDIETALRANPSVPRTLIDKGDVDAAIADAAVPDARLDRSILRGRRLSGRPDQGLVRHAKPAPSAHRTGAADPSPRSRDRGDPAGSGRVLRAQLRR
jgi:nicotinate dehydrogenase subunit B